MDEPNYEEKRGHIDIRRRGILLKAVEMCFPGLVRERCQPPIQLSSTYMVYVTYFSKLDQSA